MKNDPADVLQRGRKYLDPVLTPHGFVFYAGPAGRGSGGPYASAVYKNRERELELHFRFSLGLVTYHFGPLVLAHTDYMRALLGPNGGNQYPGFSEEPLDAFKGLAHDLQAFAAAFLEENFAEFQRYHSAAEEWNKTPGIARLPK